MMARLILIVAMLAWPILGHAGTVSATRTLPAGTILRPGDLVVADGTSPAEAEALMGLETRVTIYAGRQVSSVQLRAARLITRNQVVPLIFRQGALSIEVSGRALDEGAAGDVIPVMNLASRQTVSAMIAQDGTLRITR